MGVGKQLFKESDGQAVYVDLLYSVEPLQAVIVDKWLGISMESGDSGDRIALDITASERQFTVPATLTVNKGDIIYIDVTEVEGHALKDDAYKTSADTNRLAFFKATTGKDSDNNVMGIIIPWGLAS